MNLKLDPRTSSYEIAAPFLVAGSLGKPQHILLRFWTPPTAGLGQHHP